MFTGIIQEIGIIKNIIQEKNLKRLFIQSKTVKKELKIGSSVSINGVCLTVVAIKRDHFVVEAVDNTLKISNLGQLKVSDKVNLEPALLATGRLDGHLVSGHIDTMGTILKRRKIGQPEEFYIRISPKFLANVVEKGSICIDGISLTIAGFRKDIIKVVIIPHTLKNTNLLDKQASAKVNLEFDVLGKYAIARMDDLVYPEKSQLAAQFSEFSNFIYRGSLN